MSDTRGDDESVLIEELALLRDDDSRERALAVHGARLLNLGFVSRLADEVLRRVRTDAPAALALARTSVGIAEKLEDDRARAVSARSLGNALYANEDYREAVSSYARAGQLFDALGEPLETARTLSTSIQSHILLGDYDAALGAAEKARAIFEQLGERQRIARLDINVGNIHHRQDRFREALALYERAYRELMTFPEKDAAAVEGVAAALSNIAGCLIMLNEYPRALSFYREARAVCEAEGMTRLVAQADYNIAYMYFLRGEYSESVEMLNVARQLFLEAGDSYHTALCDMDQAEIYLELNLHHEARRLARRAYRRFRKMGTGYEASKSLALEAIAEAGRGGVYRALGLFSNATEGFARERNRVWPSIIDLYRASVLLEEGRLFEAHRFARCALSAFESTKMDVKAMVARLLLAEIDLEIGDLPGAGGARRARSRAVGRLGLAARRLPGPLRPRTGGGETRARGTCV